MRCIIKRSRKYDPVIAQLCEQPDSIFRTIKDAYVFAAFLGFSQQQQSAPSAPIHELDVRLHDEMDAILALAFADMENKDALADTPAQLDAVLSTFERYLEGGLSIVHEWLTLMPADTLGDRALIQGLQDRGLLQLDLAQNDFPEVTF